MSVTAKLRRLRRIGFVALILPPFSIIQAQTPPAVSTTVLEGPEGGAEAFEPSLAIAPTDPDRIAVGAMYGIPMGRGGRDVWVWNSSDGGRKWTGARRPPPVLKGQPSNWSPDVIMGFAEDGAVLVTSMGGSITPKTGGLGGIYVTRQEGRGEPRFGDAVEVMSNRYIDPSGKAILHDKPWMIVDHDPASRHRGFVYVTTGALEVEKIPDIRGSQPAKILDSQVVITVSRDGGKTFGPVQTIARSAFANHLAIGKGGSLDVVYTSWGAKSGLFYRRSTDGGRSFDAPVTIVTAPAGEVIGIPTVAARPNGALMACWSQSRDEERVTQIVCASKPAGGAWRPPGRPSVMVPAASRPGWPMLAGSARGWSLILYLTDASQTEVAVFRSGGADNFAKAMTLAKAPGVGLDQLCLTVDCRRYRTDKFAVGDYVGLAVNGSRLAAAYILPRPGKSVVGSAAVYVSTWDESR